MGLIFSPLSPEQKKRQKPVAGLAYTSLILEDSPKGSSGVFYHVHT
jgi:hypothetical protein